MIPLLLLATAAAQPAPEVPGPPRVEWVPGTTWEAPAPDDPRWGEDAWEGAASDEPEVVREPIADLTHRLAAGSDWCTGDEALLPREILWCAAVPPDCTAMATRCEELKASLEHPWWENLGGCGADDALGGPILALPDLSAIPRLAGILAIALAAALVVRAALVWIRDLRAAPVVPPPEPDAAPQPRAAAPPPFDLAGDLLGQAREAIDRGDPGTAVAILRFAALSGLHRAGLLTLHSSRTDREYVRALAAHPDAAGDLRRVVTTVEKQRYAGAEVARPDLESAYEAAARLARRAAVGVALVLLVLQPATAGPGDADLFGDWLQARGYTITEVGLGAGRGLRPCGGNAVVVVADDELESGAIAELDGVLGCGGVVLLLGSGAPSILGDDVDRSFTSRTVAPTDALGGDPLVLPMPALSFVPPTDAIHLAEAGDGVVAASWSRSLGTVVAVSIPAITADASLLHPPNAAFLDVVIRSFGTPALVVARPPRPALPTANPLEAFLAAGLLPALGHGLVAFLLAAWAYGRRFAAPRLVLSDVRRDFTEHLRAAGRLYRESGASRQVLGAYARWTLHRLRARTRATDAQLGATVAARTGRPVAEITRVLDEARDAAARPDATLPAHEARGLLGLAPGGPVHDLSLQEELWQILAPPRRPPTTGSDP